MPRFAKFAEFPLGSFDGFDDRSIYQMVPLGNRREMGVTTESSQVRLRSTDPSIARFASFRSARGTMHTPDLTVPSLVLPANGRIAFSIMGVAPGSVC